MSLHNALLLSAIGLAWTLPALGQGCQHDMQCKGDRICNMGTCMAPDADSPDTSTPTSSSGKSMPTIKLSPQPSSPASAQPSTPTQSPQQPMQQPAAPSQAQPQSQHVSVPRSCCTVAGKLRLAPPQSGDAPLVAGDACQGLTTTGKPVPGTACN
ncbi:hypothetical protein [Cupriavidus sp. D384]|uniref:hypothetical protein n=1 Tax=Cupriavidus sp. D384 TaxID=1538095 RepID=UPI000829C20C|nr:hypothetical protein [Cupriavidus sp. D384]